MIVDFYRHFDDVELLVFQEGSTVSGMRFPTGAWNWRLAQTRDSGRRSLCLPGYGDAKLDCVVASHHPLALMDGPFSDDSCATGRRWCAKTPRERYLNVYLVAG